VGVFCVLLIAAGGCRWLARIYWLGKYDRIIANATGALAQSNSDGERAIHLGERGRGYSEKARYSAFAKCISPTDYNRLIDRAIADHARSVALAPEKSEPYLQRGQTYYDRGTVSGLDTGDSPSAHTSWLRLAEADFSRAIERNPRYALAFDRRALARSVLGDRDGVIADLTESTKIDGAAQGRLAEAYCERGGSRQRDKDFEGAIADYEKSIALDGAYDGCSCDPFAPLAYVYFDGTRQYDKSRDTIRRARAAKRWIPPELEEKLRKALSQ
jgi:tetratricopeptide (TPR) repeat protein